VPLLLASAIAFASGAIAGSALNRRYTFDADGSIGAVGTYATLATFAGNRRLTFGSAVRDYA
jgi:putative flippase GtrA